MRSFEHAKALLDKYKAEDRLLLEKIHAITLQIRVHQQNDRRNTDNDVKSPGQRRYYHWWLRVSFSLHRQRSGLESRRTALQEHIHELTNVLKIKFRDPGTPYLIQTNVLNMR